jgi:hypothetical protein
MMPNLAVPSTLTPGQSPTVLDDETNLAADYSSQKSNRASCLTRKTRLVLRVYHIFSYCTGTVLQQTKHKILRNLFISEGRGQNLLTKSCRMSQDRVVLIREKL